MFGPKYTGAVDRAKARGVDFLNLDWVDHKDFRITTERMVESLLYIHRALAGGSSVVVHCAQGKSRSSTVVVAYVAAFVAPSVKAAGETALDFALRAVQSRRKMAAPNPGFMEQLASWETEGLWTQVRATSCEGAGADADSAGAGGAAGSAGEAGADRHGTQSATDLRSDLSKADLPYRFALHDDTWRTFIAENGFVVIAGVASPAEVGAAVSLLLADAERYGIDLGRNQAGLVARLAQSAGSWHVRGLPRVQEAFARIWGIGTSELITSMDAVIVWPKWWGPGAGESAKKPRTEGLHIDQNPFDKRGLECYQGMVPLLRVTEETGGLQVVPRTHTAEANEALRASHQRLKHTGDWCPVNARDPLLRERLLLQADAGDLILWDSRTVHGGVVGSGGSPAETVTAAANAAALPAVVENAGPAPAHLGGAGAHSAAAQPPPAPGALGSDGEGGGVGSAGAGAAHLARLTVTVAMTARTRASDEVQRLRREGFAAGFSFNHCPHEAGTSSGTIKTRMSAQYVPPTLTVDQEAVL
jgi:predicted protein tyrosine phosphatase